MARSNRERVPRVNFFDGQRLTEADLDAEQLHHRGLVSTLITDFHASGIVRDGIFESKVLLDTSNPGYYVASGTENLSKYDLEVGSYDGKAIDVDIQPTDAVYGNRLEVHASGLSVGGRVETKVLLIGTTYSSLSSSGDLNVEILKFSSDGVILTKFYYKKIIGVIFNNFSGGVGSSAYDSSVENIDVRSSGGKILIREAEPFKVFPQTLSIYQNESPNVYINNFVSSSVSKTIEEEIKDALGGLYSFSDIYWELTAKQQVKFEADGDQTIAYGQKFLSKANNIQKISLLLSVEKDESADAGKEYDFSGDIVLSIHKLSTEVQCITDPDPNNLIDFDPEPSPIIELSYSQQDLEDLGYKIDETPRIIDFDLSETLIADPQIDPSIDENQYYAFLIRRRGDNRTGTVLMRKGYNKADRKFDNGQDLTVEEKYGKQSSRYIEYDAISKVYVDDSSSSLWFEIHSDTVEVTDGAAYTDDGMLVALPKTVEYIGDSKVSFFMRDISLKNVSEGTTNLIVLNREDSFVSPGTHPRTGNFVFTRIEDAPSIVAMTESEWDEVSTQNPPIVLAKAVDNNVRDAQAITGIFDKPGLIYNDKLIFINPSSELLDANLINRVITPDTDCQCNSVYRIIDTKCEVAKAGDLDSDGELTSNDILQLLNVVGNTINTETTERKILGGELDIVDFIKSDLNNDSTVDGFDIEILEDALDGYVNFTVEEDFNILTLQLENILEEDDYPNVFVDSSESPTGVSSSGSGTITFTTATDNEALAIRVGDKAIIPSGFTDAGTYLISSKTVGSTGKDVTLTVTTESGVAVQFGGSGGGSNNFAVTIKSGTRVNTFANNLSLLDVPYEEKNWKISYISASHDQRFLEVCDLRRYVDTNFIEQDKEVCVCDEPVCQETEACSPKYKNQKVLPNDLYLPDGKIYSQPGVPYHGDIEYSNISIPIPPGSIEDCEIDLYNNFIKADSGTCLTISGYPAMKYSDGTYVGCEDSGAETDISKGRVKISQAIASLYVDSLVDGYAVDGYADETSIFQADEIVSEEFENNSYTAFGSPWIASTPWPSVATVSAPAGPNVPATFTLTTTSVGHRYSKLQYPPTISDVEDDFIIDFVASRSLWTEYSIVYGSVKFFGYLNITNADGTTAVVEIGWRETPPNGIEIYYSGVINDSSGSPISVFDYSIEAPDHLNDKVTFRLRRTNEAIVGMYHDPTSIDATLNPTEQFIRIGENPPVHPGSGTAKLTFEFGQTGPIDTGIAYSGELHSLSIDSKYSASDAAGSSSIAIGRDASTKEIDRITATFPLHLTQRTNLISAEMSFVAADAISSTDSFNIIPLDIINADNIGTAINYPMVSNTSFMSTFSPGTVSSGSSFSVDVTSMATYFLSRTGHLPGFYKAVIIEPSASADSSMLITSDIDFSISYEDISTGVIFKIGASIDAATGVVSLKTKNVLYDALNKENRTVLNFGVHLKKSGFRNKDLEISIKDLNRIGIGACVPETGFVEDELCFFIAGNTGAGTFVQGPFPCQFHLP